MAEPLEPEAAGVRSVDPHDWRHGRRGRQHRPPAGMGRHAAPRAPALLLLRGPAPVAERRQAQH